MSITDSDIQELTPEDIIKWAGEYPSYSELELTAKALYGMYTNRRKNEYPKLHKASIEYSKRKRNNFKKPKKNKWSAGIKR